MAELEEIKKQLAEGRYPAAARRLDRLLATNKNNDELWYLRGLVALKAHRYDFADEAFEHAVWIRNRPLYWKMRGIAQMEGARLEEAIASFRQANKGEPGDVQTLVFTALCYMLINDPTAQEYIQRAYVRNRRKTKQMLKEFYTIFFQPDRRTAPAIRKALEKRIEGIPA